MGRPSSVRQGRAGCDKHVPYVRPEKASAQPRSRAQVLGATSASANRWDRKLPGLFRLLSRLLGPLIQDLSAVQAGGGRLGLCLLPGTLFAGCQRRDPLCPASRALEQSHCTHCPGISSTLYECSTPYRLAVVIIGLRCASSRHVGLQVSWRDTAELHTHEAPISSSFHMMPPNLNTIHQSRSSPCKSHVLYILLDAPSLPRLSIRVGASPYGSSHWRLQVTYHYYPGLIRLAPKQRASFEFT